MRIDIITIFPDYFTSTFAASILGRAMKAGHVQLVVHNLRDFTTDKHHTTDDRPYGGGPGMVMKVEPIAHALEALQRDGLGQTIEARAAAQQKIVLTSAKGSLFTQVTARSWSSTLQQLVIICGHYEGVDERVAEHLADEEVRIGDYVLTGGEPAALVMTDAVARLVPGVLGNEESNLDESHREPGLLGHPQFTRPEDFRGWKVPAILLQGHHAEIGKWRQEQKKVQDE